MFTEKLEELMPKMNIEIKKRLKDFFGNQINKDENNSLVLLYQVNLVYERGDDDKKKKIMEEIKDILN